VGGVEFTSSATNAVYLYNPATDAWTSGSSLLTGRSSPAIARGLDGRVYVFGGATVGGAASTSVEAWDPTTGLWSTRASFSAGRGSARAFTSADGRIWLMGGVGGTAAAPTYPTVVEVYTPTTNAWATAPVTLPSTRYGYGATVGNDGRFYLIGGYQPLFGSTTALRTVTVFDPATSTFSSAALLPQSRSVLAAATLPDGRILAMGGNVTGFGSTARVDVYNPTTNTWR
jgi:N-acetylneuraminic acid mutarotase